MSLINQMLQDLEQRNASSGKTEPISGEVRTVSAAKSAPPRLLVGLLALSLLAAGAWFYLNQKPLPAPAPPLPVPAKALPAAPPPVVAAPVAAPPAVTPTIPATPPVIAPVEAPAEMPSSPVEVVKHLLGLDVSLKTVPNAPLQTAKAQPESRPRPLPEAQSDPEARAESKAVKNRPSGKTIAAPADGTLKTVNAQQQSENFYRQSIGMMQMGRAVEAQEALRHALEFDPANLKARQTLIGLLVEGRHHEEAVALLQGGLKLAPEQSNLSMSLARLQVEAGNVTAGTDTLERGLRYAGDDAEYHAFYAALLQRAEHHEDAVAHYLIALKSNPAMPTWLVGIAISWQALGKVTDAGDAYRRARETGQLTPQLNQFVDQRLKQLRH